MNNHLRENFLYLLENSPVGIAVSDMEGKITFVTSRLMEITGKSKEELVGTNTKTFFKDENEFNKFKQIINDNETVEKHKIKIKQKNGNVFFGFITAKKTIFSEQAAVALWFYDATEQVKTEKSLRKAKDIAEEASQAKTMFFSNMSHELRTPLNAVIGYSQLLTAQAKKNGLNDIVSDLGKIKKAGKYLLSLINDILDISKIEAGKVELNISKVDIKEMILDVLAIVKPLVSENRNEIKVFCEQEIGTMQTDEVKLRQNLFNLLGNACKFTTDGIISVDVRKVKKAGSLWIEFCISDTGIGIKPDTIEHIFEPFHQGDSSIVRKYGGTGLGLVITKCFCDMLGGSIFIQNNSDKGANVVMTLPACSNVSDEDLISGGWKGKVLLIDDDPALVDFLGEVLTVNGYRVFSALNAEYGLRSTKEHKPDIIVLDILMPKKDGMSVLTELKSNEELADIPVIILTITTDEDLAYCQGASDFIMKPVEPQKLIASIEKICPAKAAPDVLIVDKDEATRDVLREMIEKEGLSVAEANNGEQALNFVAKNKPSVIITELLLPVLSGFDLIDKIKFDENLKDIEFVVVTAKDISELSKHKLEGKILNAFQKGKYSPEELISCISLAYEAKNK